MRGNEVIFKSAHRLIFHVRHFYFGLMCDNIRQFQNKFINEIVSFAHKIAVGPCGKSFQETFMN